MTPSSFPKETMISVTLVMQNDQSEIAAVLNEVSSVIALQATYYEILIVDNRSTDQSVATVRALQQQIPNIRLIVLSRRHDKEVAFAAALDHSVGDYVVLMDVATDPPSAIPRLLAEAAKGADVVIAQRSDRKENSWLEKRLAHVFYKLYANISGFYFAPNASYFRVLSRRAVNSMTQIRSKSRYLKYFNAMVGYTQVHVTYDQVERATSHHRKEGFFRLFFKGLDLLISNSIVPLRFATLLGLLASFLNLLYIGYIFIVTLVKQQIAEGWISTSVMNATMFFILFSILTIMSEYIVRILIESKDQPLYFIADEYNSNMIQQVKDRINVV